MKNPRHSNIKGFSLIELMITVAILGILIALGYPSYQAHLINGHRSDAQSVLMGFVTAMERYRTDNNTYLGAESGGSFPSAPDTTVYPSQSPIDSDDKRYNLVIQAATASSYTLRATPISGSAQDGNGYLEITSTGIKRWDQDNSGGTSSNENTWED